MMFFKPAYKLRAEKLLRSGALTRQVLEIQRLPN